MPRFKVFGAYRTNGQDCAQVFTADDEDSAIARALEVMIVEKVVRLPDPLSPRSRPTPTVTAASLADPGGPLYSTPPPVEQGDWQATPTVPYATPATAGISRRVRWIVVGVAGMLVLAGIIIAVRSASRPQAGTWAPNAPLLAKAKLTVADVAKDLDDNLFTEEKKTLDGKRVLLGESPTEDVLVRIDADGDAVRYAHIAIRVPRMYADAAANGGLTAIAGRDPAAKKVLEGMLLMMQFVNNTCPNDPMAQKWMASGVKAGPGTDIRRTFDRRTMNLTYEGTFIKFAVAIEP